MAKDLSSIGWLLAHYHPSLVTGKSRQTSRIKKYIPTLFSFENI
jgi:hypothetical protein